MAECTLVEAVNLALARALAPRPALLYFGGLSHSQIAEPFLIRGHDKPRRVRRAATIERVFVCARVIIPVGSFLPVAG